MANMVYDLVAPQMLIDYIRAFDNEQLRFQFTLDQFLPNRNIEDLEYRIRAGTLVDVDTAEFRSWDTQPGMTSRPGVSRKRGELPPVSRQTAIGEEELLRLRELQRNANATNGGDDPIIGEVYNDAERMVRSVQARIELARGQLLSTGKVTIAENGLAIEADFGVPGANITTAANLWTDATNAKPVSDMLALSDYWIYNYGTLPGAIVMAKARFTNLMTNLEMRQVAASNGTVPNRLNAAQVRDVFAAYDLPPIVIYDTQVRVNGVQTRVLPANKIIIVPPANEPFGNTFYGVTAEAIKLASKGYIDRSAMPGIVACVFEEDSPVQTFTLGTAVALPVIANPQLLGIMTVA